MLGDIYLKDWSNNPSQTDYYLPIYILLKIGGCAFIFIRSALLTGCLSIKASYNIHSRLMKSLLKAPINLFYDINTIDESLAFSIGTFIAQICQTLSCILMGLLYFPYIIIFLPIFFLPAKHIGFLYKRASRELTRLESISRSPILNNFKQTLSGVKFVRVFNQVHNFINKNQEIIDTNSRLNYSLYGCRS